MLVRVFFAFLPVNYVRPGGVWWYRNLTLGESREFIDSIKSVATAIRVTSRFELLDPNNIQPPTDASIVK